MLESFIYFPETTFEEEKSQSSADSNNSKKRNHKAVLTATIVVTVIIAILKCMHDTYKCTNKPLFLKMMLQTLKK